MFISGSPALSRLFQSGLRRSLDPCPSRPLVGFNADPVAQHHAPVEHRHGMAIRRPRGRIEPARLRRGLAEFPLPTQQATPSSNVAAAFPFAAERRNQATASADELATPLPARNNRANLNCDFSRRLPRRRDTSAPLLRNWEDIRTRRSKSGPGAARRARSLLRPPPARVARPCRGLAERPRR